MHSSLDSKTNLSRAIMRRVYYVYMLKRVLSPFGIKLMITISLAFVSSVLVSVPAIVHNALAHGDTVALVRYFLSALTGTSLVMKTIVFAFVLCAFLMLYDIVRMMREKKGASISAFHRVS